MSGVSVNSSHSFIMNILYISKDVKSYKAAMYQYEFLQELERQANILVYGPGEKLFDQKLDINQVISILDFNPDWILVGHAWLSDKESGILDFYPSLKLEKTSIPKAIMLNKEYVRLHEKLSWIKNNNFQAGFSHHHNIDYYCNMSNTPFYFLPFAFDANKVLALPDQKKTISLSFSGLLQNQNMGANQSDIRLRVMNAIFKTAFDIPLYKRSQYRNFSIFWNSIPRKGHYVRVAKFIGRYERMSDLDYYIMQKKSILFFNSPSPMGIISPRIFENMACRTIPFSVESELYNNIFNNGSIVTFKNNLSDFYDKFLYYLENESEANKIIEMNYSNVFNNHTWKVRVKNLIDILMSS
jgi:glycosyltransferase involved in cell wall biosynthesis